MDHLCVGFTQITGQTLVAILKPPIIHLDAAGITVSMPEAYQILKNCHTHLFTMTFKFDVNWRKVHFKQLTSDFMDAVFHSVPARFDFYL